MSDTVNPGYGQEPRANPFARWTTIVIGILLVALAVIAGRDIWVLSSQTTQQPWLKPVFGLFNESLPSWIVPASIAAMIIGLILVIIALKPRKRTHRAITSPISLWTRPVDISRMASQTARKVPGVSNAHSAVKGSSLSVNVAGDTTDPSLAERVEAALAPLVNRVDSPKQVKVRVQQEEVNK
ncbi:hypothetical protein GP475_02260 [Corynebacterium poyangense]|uniref:Uncharacterized protein n=1 Tax=Corynebacterium poyangense TaxID=2684405 RepID=A0A7H0SM11_9CORY|nr:DUF6286 domain-containing protein [Corynebacterium poyangense]MBZ8177697.1 hypothetical protein [Corynebacterium poyangense]QNQ89586.1 hypothetical protein GP475_02260 [Corynebacterium poyangense]